MRRLVGVGLAALAGCAAPKGDESATGTSGGSSSGGSTAGVTSGDPCEGPTRCPADLPLPMPRLSDYDFFQGPMKELLPKDGVVRYEVAAPLWSDGAEKSRYIVLPQGGQIDFVEGEGWGFPEGTIVVKHFAFAHDRRDLSKGARNIETRLLYREGGLWRAAIYLWDDAEEDATLLKVGKRVDVSFIDEAGAAQTEEYIVPNLDQCASCHERDDATELLGVLTHQLNRGVEVEGTEVAQLEHMAELGMFAGALPAVDALPAFVDPFGAAPLEARARGYLHANCSHCHRLGGGAGNSGLVFLAWEEELGKLGVCKVPAAAGPGTGGHPYDIVPGKPEESILIFRMNSLDPEIKMPELPNRVIDTKGVQLVTDWIASMPVDPGCG